MRRKVLEKYGIYYVYCRGACGRSAGLAKFTDIRRESI